MCNKTVKALLGVFILIILAAGCKNKPRYDQAKSKEIFRPVMSSTSDSTQAIHTKEDNKPYYKTLKNGIRMHMHAYNPSGAYPDIGDVVYLHMDYFLNDSLLFTSRDFPGEFKMQIIEPKYPGSIYYALLQMHEKDSAEILVEAKGFYRYTRELVRLPEFIGRNDSLRFHIRNRKVVPVEQYQQKNSDEIAERIKQENSEINKYLLSHDLSARNIGDRIHRAVHKTGGGSEIDDETVVTIHYIGVFTDDKPFSDTKKEGNPFTFQMGRKQVIPGLEKGLKGIREGSKLTLIVPFNQAYGRYQEGPIPPWSTLIFHIEVIDVAEAAS
jgi:FKBP-type peptidyl-prolyl cis-trans isomerase